MKKLISFILFTACFLSNEASWAQVQVYIGPRVGLSFSKFGVSNGEEKLMEHIREVQDALPALHYGIVGQVELNDAFSIQPEILYSRKGLKDERSSSIKYTVIRNYLEVPVLAKFSFGNPAAKFFLNAGPYAAYMLNGKTKSVGRGVNGEVEITTKISFDYPESNPAFDNGNRSKNARFDYGALFGAGVALKVGNSKLVFEGRVDLGLKDIYTYEKQRPEGRPKYTNITWASSVSYLIPVGY